MFGIGEYTRSLIIANAIKQLWPLADIHFILNAQVPYFSSCPYSVHGCIDSATKDIVGVNNIISKLKPDLVVFDASGRAQQFKHAKTTGAKVAFISQHKKKRARGLKLNRLFNTDAHWVVQPEFSIEPLNQWQNFKLSFLNKPALKNIGAVYSPLEEKSKQEVLEQFHLIENEFFLFNAGSGGHKNSSQLSADVYYQVAKQFHQKTGLACIMVFGANYPHDIPKSIMDNTSPLICVRALSNEQFIALLTSAKGRVISAGDTILQCIALNKVSVAAAVSKDQPKRLAFCGQKGLILEATLSSDDLLSQAIKLLDEQVILQLTKNMAELEPLTALEIILEDIKSLLSSEDVN